MLTKYGSFITKDGIHLGFEVFGHPIVFNDIALFVCSRGRTVVFRIAPVGTLEKPINVIRLRRPLMS